MLISWPIWIDYRHIGQDYERQSSFRAGGIPRRHGAAAQPKSDQSRKIEIGERGNFFRPSIERIHLVKQGAARCAAIASTIRARAIIEFSTPRTSEKLRISAKNASLTRSIMGVEMREKVHSEHFGPKGD